MREHEACVITCDNRIRCEDREALGLLPSAGRRRTYGREQERARLDSTCDKYSPAKKEENDGGFVRAPTGACRLSSLAACAWPLRFSFEAPVITLLNAFITFLGAMLSAVAAAKRSYSRSQQ